MKLRTLGWAIAVIWATGMTVAMARIAGTLDSLAARPDSPVVVSPIAPSGPSEVAISLRAAPSPRGPIGSSDDPPPATADVDAAPPSPEQEEAHQRGEDMLAQMVAKGGVDDESLEALHQAIIAMRPADRMQVLGAFAAAASRGEISVTPDDYPRILP